MTKEIRNVSEELRYNQELRNIEGYAVVFDDETVIGGQFFEKVERSALDEDILRDSDIIACFNHDDSKIFARSKSGHLNDGSLFLKIDDHGLYFRFNVPNTTAGNDLIELMRNDVIPGCSFAFTVSKENSPMEHREDGWHRTIKRFDALYDVCPVTRPAYPTTTVGLRDIEDAEKELEELRKQEDEETSTEEPKQDQADNTKDEPKDSPKLDETDEERGQSEGDEQSESNEPKDEPKSEDDEQSESDENEDVDKAKEDEKDFDAQNRNKVELQDRIEFLAEKLDSAKTDELRTELTRQIDALKTELETRKNINTKPKTMENFSLIKSINDVVNNRSFDETSLNIFDQGAEEMRKSGLNYTGQITLPMETRANIVAGTATLGKETIATDKLDLIGPLYANMALAQAGATFMSGLVGDVSIPVYSGSNTAWAGETAAAADGAGTFSEVKMSPKRLTAYLTVSKQFLAQDSTSAEALLKSDIVKAISEKLESTILGTAAGSTTQPAGLFNGVTADTTAVDWASIVNNEAALESANVNNYSYIVSPTAKAALKQTAIGGTKSDIRMIMDGNEVDGHAVVSTSNVAGKGVLVGDFSEILIGQWGAIDLIVDPYTQAKNGCIVLVINAYFDAVVRRPQAINARILK